MAEDEEKPIRVVDRRMFTPDGELRPEYRSRGEPSPSEASAPAGAPAGLPEAKPRSAPPAAPETPSPEEPGGEGPEEPGGAEPRSDFASLVRSLATTAYAALGLLSDPATGGRHRDPLAARQMIDWLATLEQKSRGNLSFEESDFLSRVLYELRLAFVEAARPPK